MIITECRQSPSFFASDFLYPILLIIDNDIELVNGFPLIFSFFIDIFFIFWVAQISHV